MPKFDVDVNGQTYEVDAPDERTAWAYAKQKHDAASAPAAPAAPRDRTLGEQVRTLPQDLARQLALTGRNVVTGATAIPGIFADASMAGYNLLTGGNQQMPTEALQGAMTRMGVPEARTGLERGLGMLQSAAVGGKTPMPKIGPQAPANFQRAPTNLENEFAATQPAGYVVPPSTIKPTAGNVALESVGGKIATAQTASLRNQEVTNRLASQSVGLSANQPLTPAALKNVRETAGAAYQKLGNVGRITPDLDFYSDIARIRSGIAQIQRDFPTANVASGDKIDDLVQSLQRPGFDSRSGLEYIKELRKSAVGNLTGQNATDPANRALGTAQQKAADALEDIIERQLAQTGNQSLVDEFRAARQLIAKTYTVQNALETTGNVNAAKLAQLLRKDRPLSPELTTAARFAGAFPKAAAMPERIGGPGVSALDATMAGAGGALGLALQSPQTAAAALAFPFARYGARNLALSEALQRGLLKPSRGLPSWAMGTAAGAAAQDQE
jgi:hypothetical protein